MSTCHLWACSGGGRVFVLQDATSWLASLHSAQALKMVPSTSSSSTSSSSFLCDNWGQSVDGQFDAIACGPTGIVCGRRSKVLYLRKGVSYDNPLGLSWVKGYCDVQDIGVGGRYVVRRTSTGDFFAVDFHQIDISSSVFFASWNALPPCDEAGTGRVQLFAVDSNDNLIVFGSQGDVYVCHDLSRSADEYNWIKIAGAPPISRGHSASGLLSYLGWGEGGGGGEGGGVFMGVSAGDGCVWCLCDGGKEVCQLVLSMDKDTKLIHGSWKNFRLPQQDQLTLLAGDKFEIDILYGVASENKLIVSYSVLQEDSGRLCIPNPAGFSQRWRSLSVCSLTRSASANITTNASPSNTPTSTHTSNFTETSHFTTKSIVNGETLPPTVYSPSTTSPSKFPDLHKPIQSIYPKLPVITADFDLCCETGDCEFCRRADESMKASPPPSTDIWMTAEEGGGGGGGVGRKRSSGGETTTKRKRVKQEEAEEGGERRRLIRKRKAGRERGEEQGVVKKAHVLPPLQSLVSDVPVKLRVVPPVKLGVLPLREEVFLPVTLEEIDKRYSYPFTLEKSIMNNHIPKHISHTTSGYWTVIPQPQATPTFPEQ